MGIITSIVHANSAEFLGGPRQHSCAPTATVCICAHNEAAVLADAVDSAMAQKGIPADRFLVLVVDSASSDETPMVLALLKSRWGDRVRCVREDMAGLSRARNRGLREAAEAGSDITAFIDADAIASPAWLASVLDAFASHETTGVVGGPVSVRWDHAPPRWWRRELDEVFNHFEPSAELTTLRYPKYPYGTNLAVRTRLALELGGFAEDLGRRGRALIAGEDGELCLRFERAGHHVLFVPGAKVEHRTNSSRLHRRFIIRRAFRHGRSQRVIERMHGFDSRLYPSWPALLATIAGRIVTLRCDLPFMKYAAFRVGYRWEGVKRRKIEASKCRNAVAAPQRVHEVSS